MWKERYKIGIELIDKQHMELFHCVDELLNAIKEDADKEQFKRTILFLKEYVIKHFHDEEAYQISIAYSGIEEHKRAHREFTKIILDYERKLQKFDYNIKIVKNLAGTLTAWLIYHVADADQKIAEKGSSLIGEESTYLESFLSGIHYVLEKMAGIHLNNIKIKQSVRETRKENIFIKIGLIGDKKGEVIFIFSKELVFKLVETITFTIPKEIDELACSMLAELVNIAAGNAATNLTQKGIICDITTPMILLDLSFDRIEENDENRSIKIDTGMGELDIIFRH